MPSYTDWVLHLVKYEFVKKLDRTENSWKLNNIFVLQQASLWEEILILQTIFVSGSEVVDPSTLRTTSFEAWLRHRAMAAKASIGHVQDGAAIVDALTPSASSMKAMESVLQNVGTFWVYNMFTVHVRIDHIGIKNASVVVFSATK